MNRDHLIQIFNAALSGVDPYENVLKALRLEGRTLLAAGSRFNLDALKRIFVVGAGKASVRMAAAAEAALGEFLNDGLVIAPYGQTAILQRIGIREASHPIPDGAGVLATQRIIEIARKAGEQDLLICLLSGGASALLVAPEDGISLADKQKTTELLLKSGASIAEVNAVRKHLSAIKGGRLAQAAFPASIVSLILSDVVGDDIDVIASGPTAPDDSTFLDAARVIDKYRLRTGMPARVASFIDRGVAGRERETARSGDACFAKSRKVVVGNNTQALFAARNKAKLLGYKDIVVSTEIRGVARDVGRIMAQTALSNREEIKPGERRCLLFGGETTVFVRGSGQGGRNQELALSFAREIAGAYGISMMSAASDGIDGPTDAAGAMVDGSTVQKARQCGLSPEAYLDNNDSYTFFQKLDLVSHAKHHLKTGLTGTNVMDFQIVLLEG